MAVDLKILTPDTLLPQSGFLFGADSQAVSSPSVFSVPTVKDAMNSGSVSLTDAAFISWDVTAAPVARVTLGGNRTLMTPLNIKDGGIYRLYVIQDATGGRTLAYDPTFNWTGGTAPDFSTATAGQIALLTFWSDGVSLYGSVSSAYAGFAPSIVANFASPAWDVDPPSWLDYSGTTGNRMYFDSTGKLTWAPNNILLNSATLATQTVSVVSASTKILSFTGTGSVTLSGAATGTLAGTGANNRVWLVITPSTTSLTCTVSGDVRMAQLERVTYQTTPRAWIPTTSAAVFMPRFHYDPVTLAPIGLLKEESRTNRVLWSQDFTNAAWTKNGVSASISGVSIDGRANDNLITEDTATGNHRLIQSITIPSGVHTISAYAKPNGRGWLLFYFGAGVAQAYFNLSTGALGTTSGASFVSAKTESVGGGRYRLMMTVNNSTTTAQNLQFSLASANNTNTYTGDGNSGIYIWGVQVATGDSATSYIPTTSAAVTRAADVFSAAFDAKTILVANTGAAIMQASVSSITSYVNLLGDANRVLLWADASTTLKSTSQTPSPAVLSATIGGAGTWTGGAVRAAVSWSAAGRSIVANNGTVASDSNTFGTATDVPIFSVGNGTIESMALYSINIPDAIEKTKSTVGAAF